MKRVLILVLCVILILCFVSCELIGDETETETETTSVIDDNDPYTFESVADLIIAIKKYPSQYEDKQITVKGLILKNTDGITLRDKLWDGDSLIDELNGKKSPQITILMSTETKITLLESGDRVKIIGTIKISDVEIYLDNCEYEMIKSIYE